MTEHNLFQEVKEDLERQRIEALWKQYGGWVVILALGIVLATASSTAYRTWKTDRDQKITSALINVAKPNGDTAKNIDALQKFVDEYPESNQAAFALLHAGALASDSNDKTKAVAFFDKAAADTHADPAFSQLGTLLSVETQLDTGDVAALTARLQPLAEKDAVWQYSASEDLGYLALRANDTAKARQIFTDLSQDARAPQSLSIRATDILRSLN